MSHPPPLGGLLGNEDHLCYFVITSWKIFLWYTSTSEPDSFPSYRWSNTNHPILRTLVQEAVHRFFLRHRGAKIFRSRRGEVDPFSATLSWLPSFTNKLTNYISSFIIYTSISIIGSTLQIRSIPTTWHLTPNTWHLIRPEFVTLPL
jgi:hypothetical protein